jgi:hypothetical protein
MSQVSLLWFLVAIGEPAPLKDWLIDHPEDWEELGDWHDRLLHFWYYEDPKSTHYGYDEPRSGRFSLTGNAMCVRLMRELKPFLPEAEGTWKYSYEYQQARRYA